LDDFCDPPPPRGDLQRRRSGPSRRPHAQENASLWAEDFCPSGTQAKGISLAPSQSATGVHLGVSAANSCSTLLIPAGGKVVGVDRTEPRNLVVTGAGIKPDRIRGARP